MYCIQTKRSLNHGGSGKSNNPYVICTFKILHDIFNCLFILNIQINGGYYSELFFFVVTTFNF